MNWYYSTGADPVGPHSEDDIANLLHSGKLNAKTLVWRKGFADWTALADTGEFAALLDAPPPPPVPSARPQATGRDTGDHPGDELLVDDRIDAPREADRLVGDDEPEPAFTLAPAAAAPALAGPWTRYFARSIDISIIATVLLTGLFLLLPLVSPQLYYQLYFVDIRALVFLAVPVALFINAIIITLCGNSLGKAIFGIRAEPIAGRPRFGFGSNLLREFRVWAQGLALGIPLLNFFTMIPAYRAVLRGAPAPYDIGTATVRAYSQSPVRRTLGMLFALALYAGITVLNGLDRAALDGLERPTSWLNPTTQITATIPAGWEYQAVAGPDGAAMPAFVNMKTGVVALFAVETANMDMAAYAAGLTQGLGANVTLGAWSMSNQPGIWTASGAMLPGGHPTTIYATQLGNQFWRIVYLDQLTTTPRVIVETEMSAALFRSAGVGVGQ
ncbi:MAG TPA: RDD family protein [Devosia sp.]|jgi:hypothetical protein|uniref:RDD family protein n=1 Tax=Devosia sp. TaxID=1871048 RepID=UPI002DDD275E|nr:RDD family protein [Devosia sp.]HEV2517970.1 RDD family protein [Devosia sp.]